MEKALFQVKMDVVAELCKFCGKCRERNIRWIDKETDNSLDEEDCPGRKEKK